MYIYLIIFIVISFFSILELYFKKQITSILAVIFTYLVFFLIVFSGSRGIGVGSDDINYYTKFLLVPDITYWLYGDFSYSFSSIWMEPGYIILGSLFKVISTEPVFLFLPVAVVSISIASYYYYKLSPYYFLSFLLFFSHTYLYRDINQIRSAIACAIGLALIISLTENKKLKSFFIVLLSSSFHMTGFLYFVTFPIGYFRQQKKLFLYLILFGVIASISGFVSILISNITFLGFISTKIQGYATTEKYVTSVGLMDITNIKNILLFSFLYFFWDLLNKKNRYFSMMFGFFSFGVFWRIAFSELGILSARVATLFTITEVILIPLLVSVFKNKTIPFLISIMYGFTMLYLNLFVKEGRHPYFMSFGVLS